MGNLTWIIPLWIAFWLWAAFMLVRWIWRKATVK